ncbi:GtrA family protein [Cesiribacter andamanensis]|uniref:GtrA-like protein n=1 Tax=Cesiribacter andamanensis AMV16 TaxID=1279009 RepID=M7NMS7_9BACT|nr:GtrA family protein [Cesiribacter andamanensis]EMR03065.1 GtrA-like protein [Cesiribacter andamanensis AMV16]
MDIQTYRYLACGGINVAMDILMFFIAYHYIVQKQIIHLPFGLAVSPYIAAFIISFCICFPLAFLLMRHVAFPHSALAGRTQLIRYFSVVMLNLGLHYVLLKLFVETFAFYPTPAKVVVTGIGIVVSYLLQKHYSFKQVAPPPAPPVATPTPKSTKKPLKRCARFRLIAPLARTSALPHARALLV